MRRAEGTGDEARAVHGIASLPEVIVGPDFPDIAEAIRPEAMAQDDEASGTCKHSRYHRRHLPHAEAQSPVLRACGI